MGLKPDHWIIKMAREHRMIEPFVEDQVRDGVISYGVSSYGYDIRVADEFKIFTNVYSAVVDPKNFDPSSMVDFRGEVCIIPPNSFVLTRTVEYFRIPRTNPSGRVTSRWRSPTPPPCRPRSTQMRALPRSYFSRPTRNAGPPTPIKMGNTRSSSKSSYHGCKSKAQPIQPGEKLIASTTEPHSALIGNLAAAMNQSG